MPQPNAGQRAREQAKQYKSMFASSTLELDNGDIIEIPPHPNLRLLDDDKQEAYEELLFEVDTTYDRGPDMHFPEQHLESGVVIPEETRKGPLLEPYRVNGCLVKPPHSVRVVQTVLGAETYAKLRAGGKSAKDVWRIWNEQGMEIADRERADFKSNGRNSPMG